MEPGLGEDFYRTCLGCARSIKVVLGCSPWKTERNYCLIKTQEEEEKKKVSLSPFPLCGHWSAGSDSRSVLNHPGVQSQPVLPTPLFRKSPKIIESVWSRQCHGAPISPPAPAFFVHPSLYFAPSYVFFCTPLSSPISSSLWLLFPPFLPVNLCLPATPHCKGSLCAALMERLLSNKDAHAVEQRQQIGSFVAGLRRLFHHEVGGHREGMRMRRVVGGVESNLFIEVPFFKEESWELV